MDNVSWKPNDEIKIEIGKRIKEIREEQNLTQKEFAEILERSQNQISRLETGENLITTEMLLKLYYLYGIDIKYVLTGETSYGVDNKIGRFISWYGDLKQEDERNGVAKLCESVMEMYKAKPTGE